MPAIFISRDLKEGSPLQRWATETGWEVIGRSLISFAPVDFVAPDAEQTDWWFFYSPRAVQFAAGYLMGNAFYGPGSVKLAAIGQGTARSLREHPGCFNPDFVGEGSPQEVAAAFGRVAAGQRVFFPRARQSRLTVQTLLQHVIKAQDAICYDNVAVPVIAPIAADVYVFTSPLNVAAYLDHQKLVPNARVLAIGPSTGHALAVRGVLYEIAKSPGEAAVVDLLR